MRRLRIWAMALALVLMCSACSSTVKKQTEVQAGKQTEVQAGKQTEVQAGKQTEVQAGKQTEEQGGNQAEEQTGNQAEEQTGNQAEEQTGKQGGPVNFPEGLYLGNKEKEMAETQKEAVPLASSPLSTVIMPSADALQVYSNTKVAIDASHLEDGYVMVKVKNATDLKLKVIVTGPSQVNYTYNLNGNGQYEVFPLSDGDGSYKVGVYQNISGTKYSTLFSQLMAIKLKDQFAPFLLPNQYVNYSPESKVVAKAQEITKDCTNDLQKVEKIYSFVVENLTYDKQKAATVTSGYLPDLDAVLESKTGICFDYSAVMAAMLRSQRIPTKLVIGYTGSAYHAWLNTYTKETGWVEGVIFFDGTSWKLMDPTFASSAKQSSKIMEYIGNGSNYSAKYLY